MNKHTIVITGGHVGLGLAATRQLLTTTSANIVWATRSPEAARQTAQGLAATDRLTILPLDLAKLSSVHTFANTLIGRLQTDMLPPLSTIICNAGIQFAQGIHRTAEGIEQTFGVNHLAHFLLVSLLRPHLNPKGRIVVVSSGTHFDAPRIWQSSVFGIPAPQYLGALRLANGDVPATMAPDSVQANQFRYATSKLCNLLFSYELNRQLRAEGLAITVAAFDPGLMPGTGLARANPAAMQWVWNHVLPVLRLFDGVNSPETSGKNLAWLATDPAAASVTGTYYEEQRAVPSSALSRQTQLWADLWAGSDQLIAQHSLPNQATQ